MFEAKVLLKWLIMDDKKTDQTQEDKKESVEKPAEKTIEEKPVKESAETGSKEAGAIPVVKPAGKIVLVEDDLPMVKMYSTKLLKENFEVVVAYDGEDGLAKIKEFGPDLVVLDLMVPKIGGMEVLTQLRADSKTKNLPVIILSNLSQDQDIEKAKQLGVKEFLVKANHTPSQVVEKIKTYLKG